MTFRSVCDTPEQSALAAVAGGLVGGAVGLTAGLGPVETAVLAGGLGGLADVGAHLRRGDAQFGAALRRLRG